MRTWITSDWHLGESRMEIMMRPFESAQQHVNYLVERHNELVKTEDFVIVVGDAVNKDKPDFLAQCGRFNGHKILVRGNHDETYTDEQFSQYFEEIIPHGEGIFKTVSGVPCYITHYPTQGKIDRFNLVGHIHSAWKFQLNSFNVGVDCNHFRPHDLDKMVPFVYNAICNAYDNDVWSAYHNVNQTYQLTRGQKTTYYKK